MKAEILITLDQPQVTGAIINGDNPIPPVEINVNLEFEIRHIRNRNNPFGGSTVMSYIFRGVPRLLVSKCHPSDRFCRRVGVICCLQKWIDLNYPGAVINLIIHDNDKIILEASTDSTKEDRLWWVPKS